MKACIIEKQSVSLKGVRVVNLPDPEPGANEVLIRIRATSLNFRDYLICVGKYGTAPLEQDTILLSDGAGEVVATGRNVTRFRPGDRAAGTFFQVWKDGPMTHLPPCLGLPLQGVLCDYVALHEDGAVRLPDGLSFEEAAALPCAGVTAWNATMVSGRPVRPGETVLCLGAGGVAMLAAQFADAAGARLLIASSGDDKLKRAYALLPNQDPADGINYREIQDWDRVVLERTEGRGADHIIELGGAATLSRSYTALAFGGRIALVGFRPDATGDCNPWPLMPKDGHIDGIGVGSTRMFEDMLRAVARNRIKPPVDRIFPFADAVKALEYLASGSTVGKIVITL